MVLMDRRRCLAVAGGALLAACTSAGQGARPGDALRPVYARPDKDEWPVEFFQLPAET